jgi:biopolymer transport protein TolR
MRQSIGRRARGERKTLSEINVTPFVDVLLVLLIIFMVTAPFLQQGIEVNLPRTQTQEGGDENRLVITIDESQRVYFNETPVNIHLIEERLGDITQATGQHQVYLKADRAVPHGFVMLVMDKMRQAGIDNFGIVTQPDMMRLPNSHADSTIPAEVASESRGSR